MRRRVKITTDFPSVEKVAKKLGVSRTVVIRLSRLAERSQKTGKFVFSGVRKRISIKSKLNRSPKTRKAVKIPAKRTANLSTVKASRGGVVRRKK